MVPFNFENFWNTTQMTPVSLDISICFTGIFFQSSACLLIFLTVSFTEQKFSVLMKFDSSVFSFMDCTFGIVSKKVITKPRVTTFLLLSSVSFVV